MEKVVQEKGVKVAFSKLIPENVWEEKLKSMRVPECVFLPFGLKSRISDRSWQNLMNLAKLGRTGVRFICVVLCLKIISNVWFNSTYNHPRQSSGQVRPWGTNLKSFVQKKKANSSSMDTMAADHIK